MSWLLPLAAKALPFLGKAAVGAGVGSATSGIGSAGGSTFTTIPGVGGNYIDPTKAGTAAKGGFGGGIMETVKKLLGGLGGGDEKKAEAETPQQSIIGGEAPPTVTMPTFNRPPSAGALIAQLLAKGRV
jgi:hypothetical protein